MGGVDHATGQDARAVLEASVRRQRLVVWLLVVAIAATAGSAAYTYLNVRGGGSSSAAVRAARVEACERTHGMNAATQVSHLSPSTDPATGVEELMVRVFRACVWPPTRSTEPDGYSVVRAVTVPGPGENAASGDTAVDEVTGSCPAGFRLTYAYSTFGLSRQQQLPTFTAHPGQVYGPDGRLWTQDRDQFIPPPDTAEVATSPHYGLLRAGCA